MDKFMGLVNMFFENSQTSVALYRPLGLWAPAEQILLLLTGNHSAPLLRTPPPE